MQKYKTLAYTSKNKLKVGLIILHYT